MKKGTAILLFVLGFIAGLVTGICTTKKFLECREAEDDYDDDDFSFDDYEDDGYSEFEKFGENEEEAEEL
ncbi:MAG: hypothetical protein ACI4J1_03970 [Ruminiclostridium sp.]